MHAKCKMGVDESCVKASGRSRTRIEKADSRADLVLIMIIKLKSPKRLPAPDPARPL